MRGCLLGRDCTCVATVVRARGSKRGGGQAKLPGSTNPPLCCAGVCLRTERRESPRTNYMFLLVNGVLIIALVSVAGSDVGRCSGE